MKAMNDFSIADLGALTLPARKVSLAERIEAGKYGYVSNDITAKRFPITLGKTFTRLALLNSERLYLTSQDVTDWVSQNDGYEVARIEHLLAIGAHEAHKRLPHIFRIVCVGSSAIIDGEQSVVYLSQLDGQCGLFTGWISREWDDDCRFLIVRK